MKEGMGNLEIFADSRALARHAAEWMTATARAATGPFRVSLSGGSTPKALYALLGSPEFRDRFPWRRVFWYWGDERSSRSASAGPSPRATRSIPRRTSPRCTPGSR